MLVEITPDRPNLERELEAARLIRNSVRQFMTNNTEMITESEQIEWYSSLDHERLRLFLYFSQDRAIGYGIINRQDASAALLTGAILEEYQGQGHGKKLFQTLIDLTNDDQFVPELDVLSTNNKAINLYRSLGFVETAEHNGVVSMVRRTV
jgi:ribosomal protein S18 acetylase RimI-like enzyme